MIISLFLFTGLLGGVLYSVKLHVKNLSETSLRHFSEKTSFVSFVFVCAHAKKRFLTLFWYIKMSEFMSDDDDETLILASSTIIFGSCVLLCDNGDVVIFIQRQPSDNTENNTQKVIASVCIISKKKC